MPLWRFEYGRTRHAGGGPRSGATLDSEGLRIVLWRLREGLLVSSHKSGSGDGDNPWNGLLCRRERHVGSRLGDDERDDARKPVDGAIEAGRVEDAADRRALDLVRDGSLDRGANVRER